MKLISNCYSWGLRIQHIDVKSVFLNSELEEEIYMGCPRGFEQQNQVCQLNKCLYGLKQSPRIWNKSINDFFNNHNFHYTNSDHGIYINNQSGIIIGIWVDDLIIIR